MARPEISFLRRRALLAGVSNYNSDSIPNLIAVKSDLDHMKEAFKTVDIEVEHSLLDCAKNEFLKLLFEFFASATGSDYLFVYFSGHGLNFNYKSYLAFNDAFLDNPLYLEQFLLDLNVVIELARSSEAREIILFIDACREGISLTSKSVSIGKFRFKKTMTHPHLHIVFSCQASEYSRIIDDERGSLFTYSLCEILRSRKYGLGTLDEVLTATERTIRDVASANKIPFQQTYVSEEKALCEAGTDDLFPAGLHVLHGSVDSGFSSHPNSDFLWPSYTNLDRFWRKGYLGQEITIYVVDGPVDLYHLELTAANIEIKSFDNIGRKIDNVERREGDYYNNRHGTAVASIVCGKNIGIAPQCRYVNLAAFSDRTITVASFLSALNFFCHQAESGRSILLLPFVVPTTFRKLLELALEPLRLMRNAIVVVAAENSQSLEPDYLAPFPFVLSVGGVNKAGEVEPFSQYTEGGRNGPDFYGIASLLHADGRQKFSYMPGSSTSYAAAFAAGVIALIWCALPNLDRDALKARLMKVGFYPKGQTTGAKVIIADEMLLGAPP